MRTTALDEASKPNNNRVKMLEAIQITRKFRRDFIENTKNLSSTLLLNKYPRLKDMPEAVLMITVKYVMLTT